MGFGARKFYVWLFSLGAVLAIYLLYNLISKTPPIDMRKEFTGTAADSNIGGFDGEGGRIGDVHVEVMIKAKIIDLDKETKEVIRV